MADDHQTADAPLQTEAPSAAPLPPTERDLLDLSLRTSPDPFLGDLLELAQHGTDIAVGLLVNGMVIIGRLDRMEAMAQALSTMRSRLIGRSPKPEDHTDEQWQEVQQGFANAPLAYVADRQQFEANVYQQLQDHADDGQVNLDELPSDLARQVRELGNHAHITLSDARVAAPGQEGMTALPIVRVAVAHVTAWWFAMPEEDGTSNIELWNEGR